MSFPPADVETRSFHLGMIYAFVEVVASGCKRLALSPPMTAEELHGLSDSALAIADEYGVLTHADDDCLETRLFNPAFTRDKHVLLFALDRATLDEYLALKELRARSLADGSLNEREEEIARRFGRLLSYSVEAVDRLLEKPRF
jgi:hypothetical protein